MRRTPWTLRQSRSSHSARHSYDESTSLATSFTSIDSSRELGG
jgi:hypothetical protein